jgi:hypothetical protein
MCYERRAETVTPGVCVCVCVCVFITQAAVTVPIILVTVTGPLAARTVTKCNVCVFISAIMLFALLFITAVPNTKLCAWGEEDSGGHVRVCLLLQYLLQRCSRGEGGGNGGHVLRETTSRSRCELVCPSRTNERGGEGYCVKEGEGVLCVLLLQDLLQCVCLLLQDLLQSCARGGGGEWRTCAMRYDEPRLVWTRLTTTH